TTAPCRRHRRCTTARCSTSCSRSPANVAPSRWSAATSRTRWSSTGPRARCATSTCRPTTRARAPRSQEAETMQLELLHLASELVRRGAPFVLATVVARTPPTSAQVGDTALVTRDAFHGWVGGSCTRPTVVAEALRALEDGQPRLVCLDPDPESRRRPGVRVF